MWKRDCEFDQVEIIVAAHLRYGQCNSKHLLKLIIINFHMFTVNGCHGVVCDSVVWQEDDDDDDNVDGDSGDEHYWRGVATAVFFQCCKIIEAKTKTD